MSMAATGSVEEWSGKDRGDENFPVGSVLISRPAASARPCLLCLRPQRRRHRRQRRPRRRRQAGPARRDGRGAARPRPMPAARAARACARAWPRPAWRTAMRATCWTPSARTRPSAAMQAGTNCSTTADCPRCRSAGTCSTCTARRATPGRLPMRCAPRLQVLNHLQDCAKDLAALDRCYLARRTCSPPPACSNEALSGRAETPALRRVFDQLLDRCDALNTQAARTAPPRARPALAAGDGGDRGSRPPARRPAAIAATRWPRGCG